MKTNNQTKLVTVKKQIEEIKKFYKHVVAYVIFNIILTFFWTFSFKLVGNIVFSNQYNEDGFLHYPIWLVWGFILLLHGLVVFVFPNLFSNKWEEKKINEFMEK